jgi:hypothetical protein
MNPFTRPALLVPAAALALAIPNAGYGQFAAELRAGGAIGNYAPAAAGLETVPGPALFAAVEYRSHPSASVYAGYSRAAFGCEDGLCREQDVSVVSSGFSGGVRVHLPARAWVRVGLAALALDIDADGESERIDPAIGYELGAGFAIPISGRFAVLPGVIYRSTSGDDRASVVVADVGLQFRM